MQQNFKNIIKKRLERDIFKSICLTWRSSQKGNTCFVFLNIQGSRKVRTIMSQSSNKPKQKAMISPQNLRKCKSIFTVIDKAEDWRMEIWIQMIEHLEWHDKESGLHQLCPRKMTLAGMMHVDFSGARMEVSS